MVLSNRQLQHLLRWQGLIITFLFKTYSQASRTLLHDKCKKHMREEKLSIISWIDCLWWFEIGTREHANHVLTYIGNEETWWLQWCQYLYAIQRSQIYYYKVSRAGTTTSKLTETMDIIYTWRIEEASLLPKEGFQPPHSSFIRLFMGTWRVVTFPNSRNLCGFLQLAYIISLVHCMLQKFFVDFLAKLLCATQNL